MTMAASRNRFYKYTIRWEMSVTALIILTCSLPFTESAAVALLTYTMDQTPDCISSGYLDIPRGQETTVSAPSKDVSTATQTLSCRLQFQPQTQGDALRLTSNAGFYFEDCEIALEVQMTNADKLIIDCRSNISSIPVLEAVDGKASIWLARKQFDDRSYWFEITVTAFRNTMDQTPDCISSGYLDIPRGQETTVSAPSKDVSTATQTLSCRLQFQPQTQGDALRLTSNAGFYFEDCEIALEVQMTNADKLIIDCKSNISSIPVLEAVDGKASIWLTRIQFDDRSYWFEITVTAFRTELDQSQGAASSGDIRKIRGITVGVLAFVVIQLHSLQDLLLFLYLDK